MRETKMKQPDMENLPSFEELFKKSIEKALKERLEGMEEESLAPALPIRMLRALPEVYIDSLPADVQEQIRKRLRDESH
jgi:hypothetical protein